MKVKKINKKTKFPFFIFIFKELGVCDYPYKVDCKGAATPRPPPPPETAPPTLPPTLPPVGPPRPPVNPWEPPTGPNLPPYQPPPPQGTRIEPDPWHQRPAPSQIELDNESLDQV